MVGQGRLSSTGNAGHHIHGLQHETDINIFQIVGRCAFYCKKSAAGAPVNGGCNPFKTMQERQCPALSDFGFRQAFCLLQCAVKQYLTSMDSGARTDVNQPVGMMDELLFMFHHDHGIPFVAQLFENYDELFDIMRVQPDGGFIEDAYHPAQPDPGLCCQTQPL